jgi:hypothetical protein
MPPQNIIITSIPKAGTHLFGKVVENLFGVYPTSLKKESVRVNLDPYKKIPYICGHIRYDQLTDECHLREIFVGRKVFVLIRDPRDVCISMVHFMLNSDNSAHKQVAELLRDQTFNEQVKLVSKGIRIPGMSFKIGDLNQHCSGFLEYLHSDFECILVRYEDFFNVALVAPKIANHLGIDTEQVQQAIENSLGAQTKTLRSGRPYIWKDDLDGPLKIYFREHFGQLISNLGYDLLLFSSSNSNTVRFLTKIYHENGFDFSLIAVFTPQPATYNTL